MHIQCYYSLVIPFQPPYPWVRSCILFCRTRLDDGSVLLYTSAQTVNNCSVLSEVTVSGASRQVKVAIRTEAAVAWPHRAGGAAAAPVSFKVDVRRTRPKTV